MSITEYEEGTEFPGVIGRTVDESKPAWPALKEAKEGAPNVLFIVLDDIGFGQLGCYGGPINTPNIDKLAEGGLRYNNMHTTALCSPSRACMLTGRNHHSNGMSSITETATGFPGSNAFIPFENGFISETLLQNGYNTYALGKWHLTPAEQTTAAGPYDRWPLGRGFERFYGFMGGETHQYYPDMVYDNHQVDQPKSPQEGYHVTEDLVDKGISFIIDAKQVAPDKPFFMYFCPGTAHAPHHVSTEWSDKYKGQFDYGWDAYREMVFAKQKKMGIIPADTELTERDPDVRAWDTCTDEEKQLYARMMEVYAGFIEHADHHIGRMLDFLKEIGQFDNTLVMLISDNGASSEGGDPGSVNENLLFNNLPDSLEENLAKIDELGGPTTFNHYPWGWAWAGNTPFRRWKRETYRGGVSDPFIVHWPAGDLQKTGTIRDQYTHAIDMLPTVLKALDLEIPREIKGYSQSLLEGVSFFESFGDPNFESKHDTQYFEIIGHRAIYHKGWRAVCPWPGPSFEEGGEFGQQISADQLTQLDQSHWELYNVAEDYAEKNNVADQNPGKLTEMIARWYVEAGKYNVLPVDGHDIEPSEEDERPVFTEDQDSYTYYPDTQIIANTIAVSVLNRPHTITAKVNIPADGAEGMLLNQGGNDGGYGLYIKDGKLIWVHNYVAREYFYVRSSKNVPEGDHDLKFEFQVTSEPDIAAGLGSAGIGILYFDGEEVGRADVSVTTPVAFGLTGGLAVGRTSGSPVCSEYDAPFKFTGTISNITIGVEGEATSDPKANFRMLMAHQ